VARHRLIVALTLMFFSMLFWSFFEQAGSSMNNFTDRNVDRVLEKREVAQADVGRTIQLDLTPAQLGYEIGGKIITIDHLELAKKDPSVRNVSVLVTPAHVGMSIATQDDVVPAAEWQAANPYMILLFGPLMTMLWAFLFLRRREPSTPVKFALGLLQLGLGFVALWLGAKNADSRGIVAMGWLALAYLLHTTGELCLSPIGLSMVTKLSPARMISTMMGAWFLATAFSQYLAGLIAKLTAVGGDEEGVKAIPPPIETVHVYGDVFGTIAIAACVSAVILFVLSPLLKKWMHEELGFDAPQKPSGH
jgi:POT family proton-dependent oligopeptide transporter